MQISKPPGARVPDAPMRSVTPGEQSSTLTQKEVRLDCQKLVTLVPAASYGYEYSITRLNRVKLPDEIQLMVSAVAAGRGEGLMANGGDRLELLDLIASGCGDGSSAGFANARTYEWQGSFKVQSSPYRSLEVSRTVEILNLRNSSLVLRPTIGQLSIELLGPASRDLYFLFDPLLTRKEQVEFAKQELHWNGIRNGSGTGWNEVEVSSRDGIGRLFSYGYYKGEALPSWAVGYGKGGAVSSMSIFQYADGRNGNFLLESVNRLNLQGNQLTLHSYRLFDQEILMRPDEIKLAVPRGTTLVDISDRAAPRSIGANENLWPRAVLDEIELLESQAQNGHDVEDDHSSGGNGAYLPGLLVLVLGVAIILRKGNR